MARQTKRNTTIAVVTPSSHVTSRTKIFSILKGYRAATAESLFRRDSDVSAHFNRLSRPGDRRGEKPGPNPELDLALRIKTLRIREPWNRIDHSQRQIP